MPDRRYPYGPPAGQRVVSTAMVPPPAEAPPAPPPPTGPVPVGRGPATIVLTDEQFADLFDRRHVAVFTCGHWSLDDARYYGLGGQVACVRCDGADQRAGTKPHPVLVAGVGEVTMHRGRP